MAAKVTVGRPLHLPSNPREQSRRRYRHFFCCLSLYRPEDTIAIPVFSGGSLRVVFAGGGTGGHVYPAIAIADEIRKLDLSSRFLFLGSEHGLERDAVPSAGYDFESIPTVRLTRPSISPVNLLLPIQLGRTVLDCWRRLRDFHPQVVVGTGGYVSAPVCIAALMAGVDVVIQEQNGYPGLTNRVLAPFVKKIFLAFDSCVEYFPKEKCIVSGNPVRASLRRFVSKDEARSYFFPKWMVKGSAERKIEVVLVLGGSSGAHAINIAMLNMYSRMLQRHKNRFIIWQTGEDAFCEMESLVKKQRRVVLIPFLHTMDLAYAAADVVVSRAGAITCTEILNAGKPSILIPSPNVVDDHQTKNANIMTEIAGSVIVTEDQELDSSTLEDVIDGVFENEQVMVEMSDKALSMARPEAARQIAEDILFLVQSKLLQIHI